MELHRCSRCARDISAEEFKYEWREGEMLCEDCFQGASQKPQSRPTDFALLRVVSILLKILAVIALAGGFALSLFRYDYSRPLAIEAAISGIVIFLACLVFSELIRLGLSIDKKLRTITDTVSSMLNLVQKRGGP